jgi:hypothetical protein
MRLFLTGSATMRADVFGFRPGGRFITGGVRLAGGSAARHTPSR